MLTTASQQQVLEILVRVLTPYLGAAMAGAAARGLCQKCAVNGENIARAQIERLIEDLAPGLHVYIGKEKTQAVVRQIWSAIDALGGDS